MGRDRDSISGKVYCTSGIPDDQGFLLNDHDMDPGGTLGLFVPATAHVGLCSPLRWRQTIRSEAVWPVAMLGGEGGRGCYRGSKGEVTATLGQPTKVLQLSTQTLPILGRCDILYGDIKYGLAVFHQRSILGCKVG